MAQTDNRDAKQQDANEHTKVVVTAAHVYVGSAVGVKPADGLLYKMGAHVTLKALGCAREEVIGDGVVKCQVLSGCFLFENSASADLIAETEVGAVCYAVDDNTVAKTSNSSARAPMGIVKGITPAGKVAVYVGPQFRIS